MFCILCAKRIGAFKAKRTINGANLTPRGIPTVPGTVCLKKDVNNLIGISIGGGAQYCPCLYIVQVSEEPLTSEFMPFKYTTFNKM